jgi:epoxyqueuosine reductase QueG
MALRLAPEVFEPLEQMPTPAYQQAYLDLNAQLDAMAAQVVSLLTAAGFRAAANPATRGQVNRETLSTPFPHKTAATRAGLGWIGKCALLVTPQLGPALRLVSVLTDAPLAVGQPVTESECGDCTACQDACQGGAVLGANWRVGMERAEFFDAFACARHLDAIERTRGIVWGRCGICMAVCPRRT